MWFYTHYPVEDGRPLEKLSAKQANVRANVEQRVAFAVIEVCGNSLYELVLPFRGRKYGSANDSIPWQNKRLAAFS
jgi:hypothetical protein